MKKISMRHMMFVAFAGALLVSGCEKEKTDVTPTGKLHFNAEGVTGEGKGSIEGTEFAFVAGDQIRVNSQTGTIDANGDFDCSTADNMIAIYPAGIKTGNVSGTETSVSGVVLPSNYIYATTADGKQKLDLPMIGKATGGATTINMKHICSVMQVKVSNASTSEPLILKTITLNNTTAALCGTVTVANLTTAPSVSVTTAGNTVTMQVGSEIPAGGNLTVSIPVLPLSSSSTTTVKIDAQYLGGSPVIVSTTKNSTRQFERAKVHVGPVTMSKTSGTALYTDKNFSVADGKKVRFAKGNLQATTSDLGANWTWSFAGSPFEYVGNNVANNRVNGSGTVSENGTVDLFGFIGASSSRNNHGIDNSQDNSDYGTTTSESLKDDWGNLIGGGWRTLTKDEWVYLMDTNKTNRKLSFAKATVNGVVGMIIFPDNSVVVDKTNNTATFESIEISNANKINGGFNDYTLDESGWSALAGKGCIFLPAAGGRYGAGVNLVVTYGLYWSSLAHESDASYAYSLDFGSGRVNPASNSGRYTGRSVRLVQD